MIGTKNIPASTGPSKVILPGLVQCKIHTISLDKVPYKEGAYNMSLHVETPAVTDEGFEGFYIEKDNPDMGRYEGQIGKIRASEYPFADGTTKSGMKVSRDYEIVRALKLICQEGGAVAWLDDQDGRHETIESLIDQFNVDKPVKNVYFEMCIGGREYKNKSNYLNFDLYLPRPAKGQVALVNAQSENKSKLMKFDEEVHIKRFKESPEVSSFGGSENVGEQITTEAVSRDFSL